MNMQITVEQKAKLLELRKVIEPIPSCKIVRHAFRFDAEGRACSMGHFGKAQFAPYEYLGRDLSLEIEKANDDYTERMDGKSEYKGRSPKSRVLNLIDSMTK